jgi:hypothetical protein
VFRVTHPDGLDTTFGDHGAAVIPVPGLVPTVVAGGITDEGHATVAFADLSDLPRFGSPPRSTFGGAVRFE